MCGVAVRQREGAAPGDAPYRIGLHVHNLTERTEEIFQFSSAKNIEHCSRGLSWQGVQLKKRQAHSKSFANTKERANLAAVPPSRESAAVFSAAFPLRDLAPDIFNRTRQSRAASVLRRASFSKINSITTNHYSEAHRAKIKAARLMFRNEGAFQENVQNHGCMEQSIPAIQKIFLPQSSGEHGKKPDADCHAAEDDPFPIEDLPQIEHRQVNEAQHQSEPPIPDKFADGAHCVT